MMWLWVVLALVAAFFLVTWVTPGLHRRRPLVGLDDGEGPFAFPPGFMWGGASADHQVEHAQPDDWTAFELRARADKKQQRKPDGHAVPGHIWQIADVDIDWIDKKADFDRHIDEDFARARAFGHNAYRFSIGWTRLFPTEQQTEPSPEGLAFYDRVFDALDKHGLQASVTLFHFALPQWLASERDGKHGVERADAISHFERFVAAVVARWGHRATHWCTINEPMVYTYLGYMDGLFPPNEQRGSPAAMFPVVSQLLKMHAAGWRIIKGRHPEAQVGIAQHVRTFMAYRNAWLLDRATAAMIDKAFVLDFLDAIETGVFRPSMSNVIEEIPGLKGTQDYVGVNFYGRYYIKTGLIPGRYEVLLHDPQEPGEDVTDLGWASDEVSFAHELLRLSQRYKKPIWILENGLAADEDGDGRRQRFIVRHVQAMWHAVARGADVRGYFYWSFSDNFEWAEGFEPRFGLFRVDYGGTFDRAPRPGAEVLKRIAEGNALPKDLWAAFRRR